jgi:hypothetical protein
MAFFQKTPAELIEADLKASRKKRVTTEQRLQYAEAQLAEYRATVEKLTNDVAENSAVAAASASVAGAEIEVNAWRQSLADLDAKTLDLTDAEKEIADRKLRAETATAIEAIAKTLVDADATLNAALANMIGATRRAADFVLDAHGLTAYLMNAKEEVPRATALIAQILKDRAVQTIDGRAKAALVMPEVIAPKQKAVPPPPTETVFFLRASKWTDETGKLQLIQKFTDATLSPALAKHAIKVGAAVERTDPVRKQNLGSWSGRQFHAEHCFALDAASATSNITPIKPMFEKHPNVPEPWSQVVPTQPLQVATRTEKPQQS